MPHLVLIGGGHAHLTTLLNLRTFTGKGHRVTVVGPSHYHYYSGMAPGLLSGIYLPQDVRFHIRRMTEDRGGAFVQDTAAGVDPSERTVALASGKTLSYDIVSFNVGSAVPVDLGASVDHTRVLTVKPIENFLAARDRLIEALGRGGQAQVLVAGGGPAGVEAAGGFDACARARGARAQVVLATSRRLLEGFPSKIRSLVMDSLASRGIEVREGSRMSSVADGEVSFEDGSRLRPDVAFLALGVTPSPIFANSPLPTAPDGGLLVNRFLQSVKYPEVFGGGDCVTLEGQPLAKVGVYAVRQNPVLFGNLLAALDGRLLEAWNPGSPDYLVILNLGDGTGILRKKGFIFRGRTAFLLKDYIDRRFMRKFQVSGEREGGGRLGQDLE